jgi:outer membrane protein assembly factor BamB
MKTLPLVRGLNRAWRLAAAGAGVVVGGSVWAANWPGWRGPHGDGTTEGAKDLPVSWSLTENVKWKVELPAWSGSSPVVWGDRIFLNTPSKEVAPPPDAAPPPPPPGADAKKGKGKGGPGGRGPAGGTIGGQDLLLLSLDRATGKELWRRKVDQGNAFKMQHNSTSPSPVTDGRHVWTVTGNGMVACFDFAGTEQWRFDVPGRYGALGANHGYGSSPVLVDGKLVVQVLHGMKTKDPSYLLALNAATGAVVWRVERATDAEFESPDAYTTPALATIDGKKQLVVLGGNYLTGHDAATGAELWRGGGLNPKNDRFFRVVPSPTVRDGMIFAPTRKVPLLAFRAGGKGDISTSQLAWSWTDQRSAPDVPTPVSDGPRFYMAGDQGSITCLDAKTGTVIYGPEETGIGRVWGSPIIADGKIYVTSQTAETAILAAGPTYKLLGKGTLDGSYTLGTPAFVDGQIFIRTGTHLYCVAK